MRYEPAINHIRVPFIVLVTLLPVVDRPFLPIIGIGLAPIVGWDFHRVLHAVCVRGAVVGEV